MKNIIILLFILSAYSLSLSAYSNTLNENVYKYEQIKKEIYIKNLNKKRDSIIDKRDARDMVRKYQELSYLRR